MKKLDQLNARLTPETRKLLAGRLAERYGVKSAVAPQPPAFAAKADQKSHPLSPIQQVYWTGRTGLYELGGCGANVYTEIEIVGVDESFVLRTDEVLGQMIARHDMLRTVFLPDGRQTILRNTPPYHAELLDLRGQDGDSMEREPARIRERMQTVKAPIDRWPLFEIVICRLGDRTFRFHVRMEGLLLDGTSRGIFSREFFHLASNQEIPLPAPPSVSYMDVVEAWAVQQGSPEYKTARAWWMDRIDTLPAPPDLPSAGNVTSAMPSRFSTCLFELLDCDEWSSLKLQAARCQSTPSAVVTAAFIEVVARWARNPKFTLGIVGSWRPPETDRVIGNFNTLYLVESGVVSGTFEKRARNVKEQLLANLEFRHFSGIEVLREINRRRRRSGSAMPVLFNSVLDSRHFEKWVRENNGPEVETPPVPTVRELDGSLYMPQVRLIPTVFESSDGFLICKWQAVEALFSPSVLKEMREAYRLLLKKLARHPENWQKTPEELLQESGKPDWSGGASERTAVERPAIQATGLMGRGLVNGSDALESRILEIWKEVLGVESIQVTDNFFDLGGDSFLAARMVCRLAEALGPEISMQGFIDQPTILWQKKLILAQRQEFR